MKKLVSITDIFVVLEFITLSLGMSLVLRVVHVPSTKVTYGYFSTHLSGDNELITETVTFLTTIPANISDMYDHKPEVTCEVISLKKTKMINYSRYTFLPLHT